MSHTLSQIASVVAGLALLVNGFILFPGSWTKGLAKGIAVSISLAVFSTVLIALVRNYGS
ncbi:hypothetical protein [Bradyrhizobium sp.]|jgi:hypothetical protein|uniref:hypothetical protein n=1 Tax=Bradyrhizobium sp. TaxID=376 RepID=UPI002DDDAB1A|nr:hypothetical protein [Bradyrhizobium sp.]HEV2154335.1 hypothetical protein [Bradyrhizobium sp.]